MKKINNILLSAASIIVVLSAISGCEPSKKQQVINYTYVPTNVIPAETDRGDAQTQIAEATTIAGKSLEEISAIQIATNPHVQVPIMDPNEIGMGQRVSVNWNGPAELLLEKIALMSHYEYRAIGVAPAIPVLVSIDAKNEILGNILRNTVYQIQTKADVMVDSGRRIIELRYHET